jgi:hypothetical protein
MGRKPAAVTAEWASRGSLMGSPAPHPLPLLELAV